MNGRPPHSYDREGDLSHYRSVFEAIERRVIPEVVITRVTPYLLVLVSAAVLGVVLPHTGGAHGYDVLLRTESADAESAGVLATLFTAFTLTFTVVAASIARLVRRFRWAALALAGHGVRCARDLGSAVTGTDRDGGGSIDRPVSGRGGSPAVHRSLGSCGVHPPTRASRSSAQELTRRGPYHPISNRLSRLGPITPVHRCGGDRAVVRRGRERASRAPLRSSSPLFPLR